LDVLAKSLALHHNLIGVLETYLGKIVVYEKPGGGSSTEIAEKTLEITNTDT